ncbi:MAG: tetratricopeptide repeat protein [Planctomycetota bacterium]|jgi:hypothetical protein
MDPTSAGPELQKAVGQVLVLLLQISGALARVGQGDPQRAAQELTAVVRSAPPGRHADEALFWRARIAEGQEGRDAKAAAARDYVDLIRRLPEGRLRRLAEVRLAALTEPGALLTAAEAREASTRNLLRIGHALHAYAADHGGRLPGGLDELLGDYLSSALTLIRPGPAAAGGGVPYLYRPGLLADIGVTRTEKGEEVALAAGVPVVVWEPSVDAAGGRSVLRLDGEVMVVRPKPEPAAGAKKGVAP